MFQPNDILFEDNHLIVVNKRCGDLVQPDPNGDSALENEIKAFIKVRDNNPFDVFLGVVHRIDRPVSGVVLFAKTSKALARMNEMIRGGQISKKYWAVVENRPQAESGELVHYTLVEVELLTGRHHQIRAQLSKIGCPIKGDLKYGAKRSNPNGGISLHSRSMSFIHPVRKESVTIEAPVPTDDNLWLFFAQSQAGL